MSFINPDLSLVKTEETFIVDELTIFDKDYNSLMEVANDKAVKSEFAETYPLDHGDYCYRSKGDTQIEQKGTFDINEGTIGVKIEKDINQDVNVFNVDDDESTVVKAEIIEDYSLEKGDSFRNKGQKDEIDEKLEVTVDGYFDVEDFYGDSALKRRRTEPIYLNRVNATEESLKNNLDSDIDETQLKRFRYIKPKPCPKPLVTNDRTILLGQCNAVGNRAENLPGQSNIVDNIRNEKIKPNFSVRRTYRKIDLNKPNVAKPVQSKLRGCIGENKLLLKPPVTQLKKPLLAESGPIVIGQCKVKINWAEATPVVQSKNTENLIVERRSQKFGLKTPVNSVNKLLVEKAKPINFRHCNDKGILFEKTPGIQFKNSDNVSVERRTIKVDLKTLKSVGEANKNIADKSGQFRQLKVEEKIALGQFKNTDNLSVEQRKQKFDVKTAKLINAVNKRNAATSKQCKVEDSLVEKSPIYQLKNASDIRVNPKKLKFDAKTVNKIAALNGVNYELSEIAEETDRKIKNEPSVSEPEFKCDDPYSDTVDVVEVKTELLSDVPLETQSDLNSVGGNVRRKHSFDVQDLDTINDTDNDDNSDIVDTVDVKTEDKFAFIQCDFNEDARKVRGNQNVHILDTTNDPLGENSENFETLEVKLEENISPAQFDLNEEKINQNFEDLQDLDTDPLFEDSEIVEAMEAKTENKSLVAQSNLNEDNPIGRRKQNSNVQGIQDVDTINDTFNENSEIVETVQVETENKSQCNRLSRRTQNFDVQELQDVETINMPLYGNSEIVEAMEFKTENKPSVAQCNLNGDDRIRRRKQCFDLQSQQDVETINMPLYGNLEIVESVDVKTENKPSQNTKRSKRQRKQSLEILQEVDIPSYETLVADLDLKDERTLSLMIKRQENNLKRLKEIYKINKYNRSSYQIGDDESSEEGDNSDDNSQWDDNGVEDFDDNVDEDDYERSRQRINLNKLKDTDEMYELMDNNSDIGDLDSVHLDDTEEDDFNDNDNLETTEEPEEIFLPTNIKKIKWRTGVHLEPPHILWDEPAAVKIEKELTPLQLFLQYIPKDLFITMAKMTNQYALRQKSKHFKPTTADEIEVLFGLHIMCWNLKFPQIHMYWSSALQLDFFGKNMSCNRFHQLRSHLHMVDEFSKPEACTDRLFKVRPIFDSIRKQCLKLTMGRNLSINEQIVPFKGSVNVKQYVKNKPNVVGVKVYLLTGSNGIVYDFIIDQGKTTPLDETKKTELGIGGAIVAELSKRVKTKGHQLFFPCYFSTYNLFKYLLERDILAAGTINRNRLCKVPFSQDLSKKRRGYSEEIVSNDGITLIVWIDNNYIKPVYIASNFLGIGHKVTKKRWVKKTRSNIVVTSPEVADCYNKGLAGSDLNEKLISECRVSNKSIKWTQRMIFHAIDMALVNSWLEYKEQFEAVHKSDQKMLDFLHFRMAVADCLIYFGKSSDSSFKKRRENFASVPRHIQSVQSTKRRVGPSAEIRYDCIDHLPVYDRKTSGMRCKNVQPDGKKCTKRTMVFL